MRKAKPTPSEIEEETVKVLAEFFGHVAKAAGLIGVSVKTAYNWRAKYL